MTHRWASVKCYDDYFNGLMTVCLDEVCSACDKKRRRAENADLADDEECNPKKRTVVCPDHPLDTIHKDNKGEVISGLEMQHLRRKSQFLDRSKRTRDQSLS
jgi:hypothetical protein